MYLSTNVLKYKVLLPGSGNRQVFDGSQVSEKNYFMKSISLIIIHTRQVTRAPRLSLSRNTIMNFQTGKRYKTIRHCWFLHTPYKRIGYVIIPKPHFQGVNV